LSAQEVNYTVSQIGDRYSEDQISDAMNQVDWCGYYFQDEVHQINFDDGSIVEFKSADQIADLEPTCISEVHEDMKTYSIHNSGRIIIKVPKTGTAKTSQSKF
jgi:hypothetical protein